MSCTAKKEQEDVLTRALSSKAEAIRRVIDHPEVYEVQLLFTEVNRDKEGKVHFTDYRFRVNDSVYFYPASTVKLPVAILALEKMHKEGKFNRNTPFFMEGDTTETTFAREIRKIFAVSDNEAYNRLFEYLGQDAINEGLRSRGIQARIAHRLSVEDADNVTTKPLIFYLNDSTTTPTTPVVSHPAASLTLKNMRKGKGYMEDSVLVQTPKDFSMKNYLPVTALHTLMKQLLFPEVFPEEKRFRLSESDREFLLRTLKIRPGEAGYDPETYHDSYVKYFVYGDRKSPLPEGMDIYSKAGAAYGYLTDCAYIIDKERDKEYIITATLYVNENGIFNDDVYEYDTIGIPFLAALGRELTGKE